MTKGCVKIQLGLCYVIEMFVGDESPRPDGGASAVGYALFDLQHRQLTQVFAFFGDVLSAAQAMALV
ncbi:MAG TPA: hypothetical protein VLK60_18355 [Variovorax sp.]|jgi:hypothetical protein|nr:hypothetical protein [Variovorax sp.]